MLLDVESISVEIDKTSRNIKEFIETCKSEKLENSSYQDWSYKDVVAHITQWISFSSDKLQSILNKVPFNDVDDFRKVNKVWYEQDKVKVLSDVELAFDQAIARYKEVIKGFHKEDLIREDLPLGFKIELWRYMVMDGSIHPNGHLLYHYLKRRNYWYFLKVLENTEDIYTLFSKGNNKVYSFEEYEDINGMVKERIKELSDRFEMNDALGDKIESYSHGMRQKIVLMGALIHDPSVWILDEPMTGLDPKASFTLKEMMKEHASGGKTVFFSTHVLEVAEKICDMVAIINKGKISFCGTFEEMREHFKSDESLEQIFLEITDNE